MPDIVRCRFDHTAGGHGQAVELSGARGQLEARQPADVPAVLAEAEAAARRGLFVGGFVAYDAAPCFDEALSVPTSRSSEAHCRLPLAWFGLFARSTPADDVTQGTAEHEVWSCEIDAAEHGAAVDEIRRAIAAGCTYLVNYTARFRRPQRSGEDPFGLYRQLVADYAGGYHAYIETTDWAVACGSPELFFALDGRRLTTRPMKGTAARGRWASEDIARGEALQRSTKERAENVMVVDLLRNDLGRIAVPGTVAVPTLWDVERHPSLWQLTSTVTATMRPGTGLPEVFTALFPSGSVTGAPKVSAMATIAHLERSSRGLYCGAVGMIAPPSTDGGELTARFAVAIRTAVVDKARRRVEYGSGGGISWESRRQAEWDELVLKTAAVEGTTRGTPRHVGLIETMGFDPGSSNGPGHVRHLDRHLARLASSAAYFGIPVPTGVSDEVANAVDGRSAPARVRVVLHPDGRLDVEVTPLPFNHAHAAAPLRLCVDGSPVASTDIGLFHKTTDRTRYDDRSRRHPLADDVVLVNERGEVTETTRANLAVCLDGRWWTPPLDCGLLPGIERARLLDTGALAERVVTLDELRAADDVATLSSLRGWRPATVLGDCACHLPDR